MKDIWRMRAEIEIEPGDLDSEPGFTKGFMNVVVRGAEEVVKKRLSEYLKKFNWALLSVEEMLPVEDGNDLRGDLLDMFERAKKNPEAIILGTFHAYRE